MNYRDHAVCSYPKDSAAIEGAARTAASVEQTIGAQNKRGRAGRLGATTECVQYSHIAVGGYSKRRALIERGPAGGDAIESAVWRINERHWSESRGVRIEAG